MEKGFLPPGITNADQGSDLNLISYSLLTAMKYKPISLKSKGFSGLSMGTADGNHSQLNSYTVFEIGVLGVWRTIHAFCRPRPPKRDNNDLFLLLGIP